jgi:large repetitive protein
MRRFGILALLSIFLALPLVAQTATYSITVNPGITFSPAGGPLAQAVVNTPYSATVTLAGGVPPYTATLTTGSLPAGITMALSGSTITFSGTPTATGTSNFTVTITGANGSAKTEMKVDVQVAKLMSADKISKTVGEYNIDRMRNLESQPVSIGTGMTCKFMGEAAWCEQLPKLPVLGYRESPKWTITRRFQARCPAGESINLNSHTIDYCNWYWR